MMRQLWWVGLCMLAGCAAIPEQVPTYRMPAAVAESRGAVAAAAAVAETSPTCGQAAGAAAMARDVTPLPSAPLPGAPLPSAPLRVMTWNTHKMDDAGWQADLGRFAEASDLLMLQEAVLTPEVRAVLEGAGMRWQLAGAFAFNGVERGVLLAARSEPASLCAQRTFEPLTILPKTLLVARYRLAGSDQLLAVANLHGINFSLGLGAFDEQLQAAADELAAHRGPIILGGDLNTWSESRLERLAHVARKLGLKAVAPAPDERRRVFGHPLDHLYVRGLLPLQAMAPAVRSSDHNPMLVRFELRSE